MRRPLAAEGNRIDNDSRFRYGSLALVVDGELTGAGPYRGLEERRLAQPSRDVGAHLHGIFSLPIRLGYTRAAPLQTAEIRSLAVGIGGEMASGDPDQVGRSMDKSPVEIGRALCRAGRRVTAPL